MINSCSWIMPNDEPCGERCEGNTPFCGSHNRQLRREKDNEKKALEKRKSLLQKAREKNVRTKDLKDTNLWKPFSQFIRLRDSDEYGICTCFTCGLQMEWNSGMQAGHFIGRVHQATRYDEQNVHAQCPRCNMFQSGMQYEYGLKLDSTYGKGTAEKLYLKSKEVHHIDQKEIDEKAKYYRQKAKELLNNLKASRLAINQEKVVI